MAALFLLSACSGGGSARGEERGDDETRPSTRVEPQPESDEGRWLRELLAFDLRGDPTDARTIALGERLQAPVTCPQPGTGCYVELPLAGQTTQVHFGDDEALQVWGPTEPFQMVSWVAGVEDQIDQSGLTAVNTLGTRPDRLWRDALHLVLLHDHSEQTCSGFCPAMIWIAPPDHRAAPGYGFTTPR